MPRVNGTWLNEPLTVVVHLAFAFDIGDEIDLDRARQMLQGELGQLPRRQADARNRSATAPRRSASRSSRPGFACRARSSRCAARGPS